MKIKMTQCRELGNGRIVNPGELLESPQDGQDGQLQAYVDNGIATMTAAAPNKAAAVEAAKVEPAPPAAQVVR